MHRIIGPLLLACLVASCNATKVVPGPPKPTAKPPATAVLPPEALAALAGAAAKRAVAPTDAITTLTGKVKILANNGAGLVSNNGGNIISDNGGGVISNNSSNLVGKVRFQLQAEAAPAEALLADAVVALYDAQGKLLTLPDGTPIAAVSDATGTYRLTAPLPKANLVLRTKLWTGGELAAMHPKDAAGEQPLDTASSLGAAYVLERFVQGQQAIYEKLPAAEAGALHDELDQARGGLAKVPAYQRAELAQLADALRAKVPAVDHRLAEIKALLIGQAKLGDGRPATEVALPPAGAMLVDARGNMLVGDPHLGRIRAIGQDGRISTWADPLRGSLVKQGFPEIADMALGPGGTVFVATGRRVFRVGARGDVTTIGGNGQAGTPPAEGRATEIPLIPLALAAGPDGTAYVLANGVNADDLPRVVAIGPDGMAHTLAGPGVSLLLPGGLSIAHDGALSVTCSGPAEAMLYRWKPGEPGAKQLSVPRGSGQPGALVEAPDGTRYMADQDGHRVHAVTADGSSRVAAGPGGPAATAGLGRPGKLALAPDGTLYVEDQDAGRIFALAPDGGWRVVAGTSGNVTSQGALTEVAINQPVGVAFDAQGRLLFSENASGTLRRLSGTTLETVAGSTSGFAGDGGPATAARMASVTSIAVAGDTTWLLDKGNARLRRIDADGTIHTVAGRATTEIRNANGTVYETLQPGQPVPPDAVDLGDAYALAIGPDGRPYMGVLRRNQVWRVRADGRVELVAGVGTHAGALVQDTLAGMAPEGDGIPAVTAHLGGPTGLAFDAHGDLYVAEVSGCRVRRISGLTGPTPTIANFAGTPILSLLDPSTFPSIADILQRSFAEQVLLAPLGLVFDAAGNLYVAGGGTRTLDEYAVGAGDALVGFEAIPRVDAAVLRLGTDGHAHGVAGIAGLGAYLSDPAADDYLALPAQVAIDAQGRLAIADTSAGLVHVLPPGAAAAAP